MADISSTANPRIKWVKKLLADAKARRDEGLWVAEGLRLAEEVVREGRKIAMAFVSEEWAGKRQEALLTELEARGVKRFTVSKGVMRELSDTQTPQGVVLAFDRPDWTVEEAANGAGPLLVLDRLRDPGNLGTLARTAEGAGAAGIMLTPASVDAGNPKALRGSMGSLLRLPVARCESAEQLRETLGRPVYVTAGREGVLPENVDLAKPFALVLGQEAEGVSREWREAADGRITIPMEGRVQSLNVATAGAVILFEAARQRRNDKY